MNTEALSYFTALFTRPEATNINIAATYSATGGSNVVVTGSASVPTTFMGMMGSQFQNITVNGSATAKWGSSRLRVALVLDTTGSMADDGKITALISATKSLLTQLQSAVTTNGDVYVSIIPFSRNVNVDNANYNASWIDWTEWKAAPAYMSTWLSNSSNTTTWEQTGPGDSCPWSSNGNTTGFTCQKTPTNGGSTTSTIPSSGTYSGYICPDHRSGRHGHDQARPILQRLLQQHRGKPDDFLGLKCKLWQQRQLLVQRQRQPQSLHAVLFHSRLDQQRDQHLDRLRERPRLDDGARHQCRQ